MNLFNRKEPVEKTSPTFTLEETVDEVQKTTDINDAHEVCEEADVKPEDVEQVIVPLTAADKQLKVIREYHAKDYVHYESLPIGGNQLVLRFVKNRIYDLM